MQKRLFISLLLAFLLITSLCFSFEIGGQSAYVPVGLATAPMTWTPATGSMNAEYFTSGLIRKMIHVSADIQLIEDNVIEWAGHDGKLGGVQYTASDQPEASSTTGLVFFRGPGYTDHIDLVATTTPCLAWAFKFRRLNTDNYGSLAKVGTIPVEIYADGVDFAAIGSRICYFNSSPASRFTTIVFSFDSTRSCLDACSEAGLKTTSVAHLASSSVNFSILGQSNLGEAWRGEIIGVWAWDRPKSQSELYSIFSAIQQDTTLETLTPAIGSSSMTLASAAFRSDLNRELLQGNWTLNGSTIDGWIDSSGGNNSASQTVALQQPTLVGSFPYFDGSNDQFVFGTVATSTTWALKFTRQNAAAEGGTIIQTLDNAIIENYLTSCTIYKSGTYSSPATAVNSGGATQTYIVVNDQANRRWIQVTNSGVTITPFSTVPPANAMNGQYIGNSGVGWYFKGLLWGAWSWNKALTVSEAYAFQKALRENYNP